MLEEILKEYEVVVGLEVHAQLMTKTKAYAADMNEYGAEANTHISAITLGHPGTLPKVNRKVVDLAIRMGLAVDSDITRDMHFARKNYFYPDLPKGYQITQDTTPICTGGHITIQMEDGTEKTINITRIHIEEDAGKSIHDLDPHNTLIDLNRAGVPLIEIVSEPEIKSAREAYHYLTEVRKLVRYLDICDGNMEEGSLRCDANVSIMPIGSKTFGERCEVKNMNSIRNVQRAIEHEIVRQYGVIKEGGTITMETRSYNAIEDTSKSLRLKEGAHDYRYFPEPDLQPLFVSQEDIEAIRDTLPPLPNALIEKYVNELGLPEYDARVITDDKATAMYFEGMMEHTKHYKTASNWLMGAVKSWLNQNALPIERFPLSSERMAQLVDLIGNNEVNNNVAEKNLFPAMLKSPNLAPADLATQNDWIQKDNSDAVTVAAEEVIAAFPDKVAAYRAGNKNLLGLFMGQVMKKTNGQADPKVANKIVRELLENEA